MPPAPFIPSPWIPWQPALPGLPKVTRLDAQFGNSVSTAGDVNGDGYSDVIVGAPYYDNGQTDEGRAYVYHGSSTGLVCQRSLDSRERPG